MDDLLFYAPCAESVICQAEHGWLRHHSRSIWPNPSGQIKNDSVRDYFMW